MCYVENRRHINYVKDLIDEIQFYMWFPIINTLTLISIVVVMVILTTSTLIGIVVFMVIMTLWKLFKLDVLWYKFRNIKLKKIIVK